MELYERRFSLVWLPIFLVLLSGDNVASQLSDTEVTVKGTVILTCSRVTVPPDVPNLNGALISFIKVYKGTTLMVHYEALISGDIVDEVYSSWLNNANVDVTRQGLDTADKLASSVTVVFKSVSCEDQGNYTCEINYVLPTPTTFAVQKSDTLTVTQTAESLIVNVDPDMSESMGYELDTNLTVSCRTTGPYGTVIQWMYRECPTDTNLSPPIWSQWSGPNPIIQSPIFSEAEKTDCAAMKTLISTIDNIPMRNLGFVVDPFSSKILCDIQCQAGIMVGSQFDIHQQWNRSFTYVGDGDNGSGGDNGGGDPAAATGGGGGDDVGIIVGCIVGALCLIALVVVIVFFWYRKKSKEDNYREDDDKPDSNNDPNLHTAPPVFYTKPEKGPKDDRDNTVIGVHNDAMDTSYDSKDSGVRGPPRYANTPDMDGPPRYERETSRGRNNVAYDEDNNGRRYARDDDNRREQNRYEGRRDRDPERRDPEERPYRRRNEEAPRSRRYSNEDGTDNPVVNFDYQGNANIGTAI